MSTKAETIHAPDKARLSQASAKSLKTAAAALLALGLLLGGAGFAMDHRRFAFAYLTGFAWTVTLGLGGLLFVLIMHVTRASWSVGHRRVMEWLAGYLPVAGALFVPVLLFGHHLYEWMGEEAHHDPILIKKAKYLDVKFFVVRAVIYFAVWAVISRYFTKMSRRQDQEGGTTHTAAMQKWSAPSILLTGLTLSFAAFDWLMSLQPHWYSTIFGVYIFAGSMTSSLSLMAIAAISFERQGLYGKVSTEHHRHDIGKFLFGFTVFWAYIAFSQYFLIWYANIPEETIFFKHRWDNGWKTISTLLAIGHFAVPFAVLMSRHAKRSMTVLKLAAIWMLFMHWVDMYWLVMPNFDHHDIAINFVDVAGFLAPAGVLAFWVARKATSEPVYPIGDPRLEETMRLENL